MLLNWAADRLKSRGETTFRHSFMDTATCMEGSMSSGLFASLAVHLEEASTPIACRFKARSTSRIRPFHAIYSAKSE